MSIWGDSVEANFLRLMNTDITASANNLFTRTKSVNSLMMNPTSTFNGAWSVQMNGLEVVEEVNNTWLFNYTVLLKLGFNINPRERYDDATQSIVNDKQNYNEAIEDVELIVKKALNASLYNGTVETMELVGVTPLEYLDDTETFATCELTFNCGARASI